MPSRPVVGLMYMMQGLRELGEDPSAVLSKYGLSLEALDPNTRIEQERELQIYAEVSQVLRDPLAGLKVGSRFGLGGYGPLVMLFMTCASAHEALQLGVRYQRLTYLYSELSFETHGALSALVLRPRPMEPRAFRFRVDGELAGTLKLTRDLQAGLGIDAMPPERVDIPYPHPAEASSYAKHFGCPVTFARPDARLWFRSDLLHVRFPTADPVANAMYRAQCDRLLSEQPAGGDSLRDRVVAHLQMFNESYPSTPDVARSFDMSERSLRRRLQEEGTSFRALNNEVKMRKACALLTQSDSPVEHVAQQLGYAESAAFIHAFVRWTGSTPAAYRVQSLKKPED